LASTHAAAAATLDIMAQTSLVSVDRSPQAARRVQPGIVVNLERDVICLFGLAVDRVSLDEASAQVRAAIVDNRRLHVATPNMNLLRLARGDADMRQAMLAADLVIADGMPLVWLARVMGIGLPGRVAGSDLFDALDRDRTSVTTAFFFGGVEESAKRLMRRFPEGQSGITAAGALAPGFGSAEDMSKPALLERINAATPDLLAVSISARKGLHWIARNERALQAPVIANLGAVIHFAGGAVKRAPAAWRRSGFEWLWRIGQEPQLWRRYGADFATLARLFILNALPARALDALPHWTKKTAARVRMVLSTQASGRTIQLEGDFVAGGLGPLREGLAAALRLPEDIVIDLSRTRHLDAAALGLILAAHGQQKRRGLDLSITGARRRMAVLLRCHGCGFLIAHRSPALAPIKLPSQRPAAPSHGGILRPARNAPGRSR
jgi:N-acetylglucosaminyldiphosphoundecaprenol N-acetyl-beta-D-mannosaminyltransferase